MAPQRRLAELFYDLRARTEGLQKDLATAERGFGKLTDFVLKNPVAAITAVGTAALGVGLKAAQMAADVERSLRRISNVAGTTDGIDDLRKSIADLSKETGVSQVALAGFAQKIAQLGAESSTGVAQRLRAATTAAAATGEDLGAIIQGLDQTLDLFGGSSADAERALGTLFAAAKGRTSLGDLFSEIQAAAPTISKLGLGIETAARALVALGEQGKNAKQAATALKDLAAQGEEGRKKIIALAESMPAATDGLVQLQKAADDFNTSTANLSNRIREQLNANLIELGDKILPSVNKAFDFFFANTQKRAAASNLGALLDTTGVKKGIDEAGDALTVLDQRAKNLLEDLQFNNVELTKLAKTDLDRLNVAIQDIRAALDRRGGPGVKDDIKALNALLVKIQEVQAQQAKKPPATPLVAPKSGPTTAEIAAQKRAAAAAAKTIADAQNEALEEASKALDAYRAHQEDVTRAVAHALVELTSSTVDDLKLAIAELEDAFRAKGATEKEIAIITEPKRQALLAAQAMDLARKGLERLNASLHEPPGKALEEVGDGAFRAADLIQDAANAAAGLATSLLGADSAAAKAFGNISQLAGAVARLGSLASGAGGLGALLGSGAGLLSALGPIGGIVAGLGGLLSLLRGRSSAPDPEEQRRLQVLEENNTRLAELRDKIGDAVKLSVSGRTLGAVARIEFTKQAPVQSLPGLPTFTGEVGKNVAEILADLRKVGVGLTELRETAKDFGITLSDSPTVDELKQLSRAVKEFRLDEFTKSFEGQLQGLELSFKLLDITDPVEQIQKFIEVLAGPNGAPALAEALKGFDLSTLAGRAGARQKIQETLELIRSGKLTAEELADLTGGLTIDQFLASLGRMDSGLDEATIAANAFSAAIGNMSDKFGVFDQEDPLSQLPDFVDTFSGIAPAIAGIFEGLDLKTKEGIEEAKRRTRDLFARNARGELTDAERGGLSQADFQKALGQVDTFFDSLLASIVRSAKEAADAAEKAEADRRARNKEILDKADQDNQAFLRRWIAFWSNLSPAFKQFASSFDLNTPEGLKAAGIAFHEWAKGIRDGTIVVDTGTLSVDAFADGVDAAGDAADRAAASFVTLGNKLDDISDDISFNERLSGGVDPVQHAIDTVLGLGRLTPELQNITQPGGVFDVARITDPALRRQLEDALVAFGRGQTDPAVRKAVLEIVDALRAIPDAVAGGVADAVTGAGAGGGGSITSTGLDNLTERTGVRIEELLGAAYRVDVQQLDKLSGILAALTSSSCARLSAPSFVPGSSFVSAPTSIVIQANFPGVTTGAQAREVVGPFSDEVARKLEPKISAIQESKRAAFARFRGGA